MSVKLILAVFTSVLLVSSCALLNKQGAADDDVYFSTTNSKNVNFKKIPTVDIEKIKRENPSQIDTNRPAGYNNLDGGIANPNAVVNYPNYKSNQDSLYILHPEYSGYYQPYSMPPFSLRDQYLQAKADRRQQRRLARINNRNYYNYNRGYYNRNYYNNSFGYNGIMPMLNFGWNNYNGWNTGIGFGYNNYGCNNWGYNNYYNPYGYNNYYNPWGYYNYPYYNYGGFNNTNVDTHPKNSGQSKPRETIGSNLPASNGGTIDNPNPLRTIQPRNENDIIPNQVPQQVNQSRVVGNGAQLISTPTGVQYVAPRSADVTSPTYNTYQRSVDNSNTQINFRNANPQYANPAPVVIPNAVRSESNQQTPTYTQPEYNNQNTQQRNNQPTYNAPTYNTPRSNSGSNYGGGGSSGGGAGRSSGGGSGGGVSRPR